MMPVSQVVAVSNTPPQAQTSGAVRGGEAAGVTLRSGMAGRYIAPGPVRIKRPHATERDGGTNSMDQVAVVGAGLIGRAWAMVFARAGVPVRLWDKMPGVAEGALALIAERLADLRAAGLVT